MMIKRKSGTACGFALIEYLTIGSLLVHHNLVLSMYASCKTSCGAGPPSPDALPRRAAWIEVAGSTLGIVFSALVMMFEVIQLLVYFLHEPQAGIPVIQTTSGGQLGIGRSDGSNIPPPLAFRPTTFLDPS
jgi:hypothetical protein